MPGPRSLQDPSDLASDSGAHSGWQHRQRIGGAEATAPVSAPVAQKTVKHPGTQGYYGLPAQECSRSTTSRSRRWFAARSMVHMADATRIGTSGRKSAFLEAFPHIVHSAHPFLDVSSGDPF